MTLAFSIRRDLRDRHIWRNPTSDNQLHSTIDKKIMFDIELIMIKASTSWFLWGGVIIFWEKNIFRSEISKKKYEAYVDIVLKKCKTTLFRW